MTDLTIIIVSYNTASLLRDCLESVFESSQRLNVEVFVVDNASSDRSSEMVSHEFADARLICNRNNLGFAAANNQAIRLASGRFILLLNSDTVVLGHVLEKSVRYMDQNPDIGVLGCRTLNPDRTLQLNCVQTPSILNLLLQLSGLSKLDWPKWFGRYQLKHWDRSYEKDVGVVSGCYLMARGSAVQEVGLLDESFFFYGEETDWCRRFSRAGWRVSIAPVGEIIHYGGASTLSLGHGRDLLLTSGLIRYHRKHGGLISAIVVWSMLLGFTTSRFLFWTLVHTLGRTELSQARRDHFLHLLRDYTKAWPSE